MPGDNDINVIIVAIFMRWEFIKFLILDVRKLYMYSVSFLFGERREILRKYSHAISAFYTPD